MRERSRKRPADLDSLAASIAHDATDDEPTQPADDGKDPAAVSLGHRGGLKGGRARAEKLTADGWSASRATHIKIACITGTQILVSNTNWYNKNQAEVGVC